MSLSRLTSFKMDLHLLLSRPRYLSNLSRRDTALKCRRDNEIKTHCKST